MTSTWHEFWNQENRIYVSDRHLEAYYKSLGKGLLGLLPDKRPLTFLDWGCGEARAAGTIAKSGVSVLLYDPVPLMQTKARTRFAAFAGVTVLDTAQVEKLTPGSVDVIFIYSVLQYVSKNDFVKLLPRLHTLLAPKGLLLIGDVVPPSSSMFNDLCDLLSAAIRNGFLFDALVSLVVTFFSDYRSIREKNGFTMYTETEITSLLDSVGFVSERMPKNIGLSTHRMLIKGVKA